MFVDRKTEKELFKSHSPQINLLILHNFNKNSHRFSQEWNRLILKFLWEKNKYNLCGSPKAYEYLRPIKCNRESPKRDSCKWGDYDCFCRVVHLWLKDRHFSY